MLPVYFVAIIFFPIIIVPLRIYSYWCKKQDDLTIGIKIAMQIMIFLFMFFILAFSTALLRDIWTEVVIFENDKYLIDLWLSIISILLSFLTYFFFLDIITKKELVLIFLFQGMILFIMLYLAFCCYIILYPYATF